MIKIPYEDSDSSWFNCVGVHRGKQFMAFVTGASPWDPESATTYFSPNEPGWEERKRWYGVIHLFEMNGDHFSTMAWLGGTTAQGRAESSARAFEHIDAAVSAMEKPEFCDIYVNPFTYEVDEYLFGLLLEEDEDGEQHAMLWPNDIMFHSPWDGEYST